MSPDAIRAESLSKDYLLGMEQTALTKLKRARNRERRLHKALQDVSFNVTPGEVVGVLGRNGAGKSTLLKILSGITRPTRGQVTITGRVGSLLEVGTGFHPELTGRENIYLNGTILGMRRREIGRHFADIVEFAGVPGFLDTPVKRYSSGMYVRLAFAVAAHLDTEVLLVDEVLAVGDAEFQAKCLGRMRDVSGEGRTVLFVSHNQVAIEALCPRSIYLEKGAVAFDGVTRDALANYVQSAGGPAAHAGIITLSAGASEPPSRARLTHIQLADGRGKLSQHLLVGEPATLTVIGEGLDVEQLIVGLRITTDLGLPVLGMNTAQRPRRDQGRGSGQQVSFFFDRLPLTPGTYRLDVAVHDRRGDVLAGYEAMGPFFVEPADVFGTGFEVTRTDGPILPDHQWSAS